MQVLGDSQFTLIEGNQSWAVVVKTDFIQELLQQRQRGLGCILYTTRMGGDV